MPEHERVKAHRPEGEKDALFEKDPIPKMRERLLAEGAASAADLNTIEEESAARVDAAIKFARESDDAAPEDALTRVFAA